MGPKRAVSRVPQLVSVADRHLEPGLHEVLCLDLVERDRAGGGKEDRRLPLEGAAEGDRVERSGAGHVLGRLEPWATDESDGDLILSEGGTHGIG